MTMHSNSAEVVNSEIVQQLTAVYYSLAVYHIVSPHTTVAAFKCT